jgi:ankyrin repeat protein
VKRLPAQPDLGQLKKQAKQLLADLRSGESAALARMRAHLPAAAGKPGDVITAMGLRLHDAQSCLAREYGFASWAELAAFVAVRAAHASDPARGLLRWLALAYPGDTAGGTHRAQPAAAERWLAEHPELVEGDPYLACAVGDLAALRRATARDPAWVNRPGGPLQLPPLVAVTHSGMLRLPAFRSKLHACARELLAAGADPNQSIGHRWPPASLQSPAADERLSALYGAAGQHHDPVLTQTLLAAGADPNDGESLYHALESRECTRLLLEAGARVAGTNALYRALDLDDVQVLQLLLEYDADPNEAGVATEWNHPLLWAIRRRRSPAHIAELLRAGADRSARTPDGANAATLAWRLGLPAVAALLGAPDATPARTAAERFVAACANADEAQARQLQAQHPELPAALPAPLLRLLPELAAQGCAPAVQCMVRLGWPIATRGGDWDASALNHAVFRGDAELTRFLLAHGAQWTEQHGFGDNCCGTLSWASCNTPEAEGAPGDWLGCAQALVAHGMPPARPDPLDPDGVLIAGRRMRFGDEVTEFLLEAGAPR